MATASTTATLDGMAKEVYGDLISAVPKQAMFQRMIGFRTDKRQGDSYHFPVVLSREHGFTFAGGANAGTAFTLESPEVLVSKDANLSGTAMVGRTRLAYGALSRISGKNKAAFVRATELAFTELKEAAHFYLEMMLIYGDRGIFKFSGVSGSGTTRVLTITKATWSAGAAAQMVNAYVDHYDDEVLTNKQNSGNPQITAVDVANRQLTVTGTSADMTALDTDNEWLTFRGWKTETFDGILNIYENTGTLFGISAATYPLWKTTSYSANSAQLTMGKVQSALTIPVGQGLVDDVEFAVSPWTFADLNTDEAALRRFVESTKAKVELGSKAISYYGPNGSANIRSHILLQAGRAIGCVPRRFRRVGSSDVTFRLPNYPGQDKFFRELQDAAGFEVRIWSDQAVVCTVPAQQPYIEDIVNSSL